MDYVTKKNNRHRQMSTCSECANLKIIYLHIRNKFWKDTFNAHKEKNVQKLINRSEYAGKTLWCNKYYKINQQTVFYKSCYVKGLTYIMDLFDGNSNFLSMNLSLKENEY